MLKKIADYNLEDTLHNKIPPKVNNIFKKYVFSPFSLFIASKKAHKP